MKLQEDLNCSRITHTCTKYCHPSRHRKTDEHYCWKFDIYRLLMPRLDLVLGSACQAKWGWHRVPTKDMVNRVFGKTIISDFTRKIVSDFPAQKPCIYVDTWGWTLVDSFNRIHRWIYRVHRVRFLTAPAVVMTNVVRNKTRWIQYYNLL